MDVDAILQAFARREADAILIGGMNFLLGHQPVLTFDVDFYIRDDGPNRRAVALALHDLEAAWGPTDDAWRRVPDEPSWLERQSVFCLTSPHGAIDIFREVRGLTSFADCRSRALLKATATGIPYRSLSDADMLKCQLALPEGERRLDRVQYLQQLLGQ